MNEKEIYRRAIANNIKHYMELNKKTRYDLCEALDIKYTTLADWLNAKTYPRIEKIELMANYFGVSKSDLVDAPRNEYVKQITDDSCKELSNKIIENKTLSKLFDVAIDASEEDLNAAYALLVALKAKNAPSDN